MHMSCFHLLVTSLVFINSLCFIIKCVSLSTLCGGGGGGGGGCVSSLTSSKLMMWPVAVRRGLCFLSYWGIASSGYAHLSHLKAQMIL